MHQMREMGYHTAKECKAKGNDDKSSRSEEANLASSGKGKSPARRVEKINVLDYNGSDDEEHSLHYHHNNRIKASEITKDDFVYFTHSQSEEVPSSELGWRSVEDLSREEEGSDDDWVPQTSAHHIAMMASRRGHVKDTGHDSDGEESTLSDVKSDDEISPRDEPANRRERDIPSAEPTTETLEVRVKGQDGVSEVVDPKSGQTKG